MKKHLPLIVCWIINSSIFYFTDLFVKSDVVLGNEFMRVFTAATVTGLFLTIFDHIAKHANIFQFKIKERKILFIYYGFANILGVWLLAKIPFATGFGITGYKWAILIGIIITFFQWLVRQGLKNQKLV